MRGIDYEAMYRYSAARPRLTTALHLADVASVVLTVLSFIALIVFSFIGGGFILSLKYLLFAAVPFILVSLFRHFFNAPRPSELFELEKIGLLYGVNKKGRSFPSRHVFSSFIIGTLLIPELPVLGAVIIALGVLIATSRVLLGIHFIRDVVTGAVIGALSGLIGDLFIAFI